MAGEPRGDALAVLRRICEGAGGNEEENALTSPLPSAAFDQFRTIVETVLHEPLSAESALTAVEPLDIERIFMAFQHGLAKAVEAPPLVVVLDQLEEIDEEQFRSLLIPNLVAWCSDRQERDIHLVLLVTSHQYDLFGLAGVSNRFRTISISDFELERWQELAQECVSRNLKPPGPAAGGPDPRESLDNLIKAWGNNQPGSWKPDQLEALIHLAQTFGWQPLLH
jgi:hypothetical protein